MSRLIKQNHSMVAQNISMFLNVIAFSILLINVYFLVLKVFACLANSSLHVWIYLSNCWNVHIYFLAISVRMCCLFGFMRTCAVPFLIFVCCLSISISPLGILVTTFGIFYVFANLRFHIAIYFLQLAILYCLKPGTDLTRDMSWVEYFIMTLFIYSLWIKIRSVLCIGKWRKILHFSTITLSFVYESSVCYILVYRYCFARSRVT